MHACFDGVTRDQMMARHKSNHIQVVYAPDKAGARRGLLAKAARHTLDLRLAAGGGSTGALPGCVEIRMRVIARSAGISPVKSC